MIIISQMKLVKGAVYIIQKFKDVVKLNVVKVILNVDIGQAVKLLATVTTLVLKVTLIMWQQN